MDSFSPTLSSNKSNSSTITSTIDPLLLKPLNEFNTTPNGQSQLTIDILAANTSHLPLFNHDQSNSPFPSTAGYTHRQRLVDYPSLPLPWYRHPYYPQPQHYNIPGWSLALPPLPPRPATATTTSLPTYPAPDFSSNTNTDTTEDIPYPFPRPDMLNPTPHSAPAQIPTFFLSSQVHVTQTRYEWPHIHVQTHTSYPSSPHLQPDFTLSTIPQNVNPNFINPQTPQLQSQPRAFGTIVELTPSSPLESQDESDLDIDSDYESEYDDQYIPHPALVHKLIAPSYSESIPIAATTKGSLSLPPPHSPVHPAQAVVQTESGIEGEKELESRSPSATPLRELPLLEEGAKWDEDGDDDVYLPRSRPRTRSRSNRRVVPTSVKINSNKRNKDKKKRCTIATSKSKIAFEALNNARYRKQSQIVQQKGTGEKIGPSGSFLWRLYKVLPDPKYSHLVLWNAKERIATIPNVHEFAAELCPNAFEMNTYKWDSFKRQCTFYSPWGIKRSQLNKSSNSQTIYLPPWQHIVARWSNQRDIRELVGLSGLAADWEIPTGSNIKAKAKGKKVKVKSKAKAKVKANNLPVTIENCDSESSEDIPLSQSRAGGNWWKGDARLPTSCMRLSPMDRSHSDSDDEDTEKTRGPGRLFTPTPPPPPHHSAESSDWGRGLTPPTNDTRSTLHTLMPFSPSAEERKRLSQVPKIPMRVTRGKTVK